MTNQCEPSAPDEEVEPPGRERRALAVAAAVALAGLLMMLAVGSAGAETVTASEIAGARTITSLTQVGAVALQEEPDAAADHDDAEVDAVFERFEACLESQGVVLDFEHGESAGADATGDAWSLELKADVDDLDAAFEACDPILEELDGLVEFFDIDPDHEAGFELFDDCLSDAGVAIDGAFDGDGDAWSFELDADLDAVFESCEAVFGDMGELFHAELFELDPADEAVFERFEACLAEAGIDAESAGSFSLDIDIDSHDAEERHEDLGDATQGWSVALEADLEGAFDECDPILDELSGDAGGFWVDGPHSFSVELDLGLDD